ncbi:hypothetical protein H8959_002008 [Pygathrix nigripes]
MPVYGLSPPAARSHPSIASARAAALSAPSPRAARGGSPSRSAAQPLRPPASGRGDRGGSCQARRTIPAAAGLAVWVRSTRGAASPVLTRRNGASAGRNGDQSAYRVHTGIKKNRAEFFRTINPAHISHSKNLPF